LSTKDEKEVLCTRNSIERGLNEKKGMEMYVSVCGKGENGDDEALC
jgi:hypothetical protein